MTRRVEEKCAVERRVAKESGELRGTVSELGRGNERQVGWKRWNGKASPFDHPRLRLADGRQRREEVLPKAA
jgi:hypothetical protein